MSQRKEFPDLGQDAEVTAGSGDDEDDEEELLDETGDENGEDEAEEESESDDNIVCFGQGEDDSDEVSEDEAGVTAPAAVAAVGRGTGWSRLHLQLLSFFFLLLLLPH